MKNFQQVYVVFSKGVVYGVYASKEDAIRHYTDLIEFDRDVRLAYESVIPDMPF